MRREAWLDHGPPALAWGAIAATEAYTPWQLALMAAPLAWAALAQARGWSLGRWHRLIELTALAGFLAQVLARTGLLATVVSTLFLLCGARLCLPRALPQRRQLLLMAFLIFLTTAISTTDLDFLLWSVAWVATAAAVLLQQNWTQPGLRRHPHPHPPPFRLVLPWTLLVLVIASGFFVVLPRLRLGLRAQGLGLRNGAGASGLSDVLELAGQGPIQANRDVVLHILPGSLGQGRPGPDFARDAGLLRCFVLEELDGQRWETSSLTPARSNLTWLHPSPRSRPLVGQFFLAPTATGAIPLPYGEGEVEAGGGEFRTGRGGGLRFAVPVRQTTPFRVSVAPAAVEREPAPAGTRLAHLLSPGQRNGSALAWSLQTAPGDLAAQPLARKLTAALRAFRYTLDNPSGTAANPLEDFLTRTRAGHCEYFACALAVMLRARGVPSRVVNGYRLGPWIAAGGYFLVTQSEAHSWVEYYDDRAGGWRVADPTPSAPPSALTAGGLAATLARWSEAIQFQWDRHVVLFSDQDQIAGLDWLQARARAVAGWQPRLPDRGQLGAAGALALGLGLLFRFRGARFRTRPRNEGHLREMRPLVRRLRKAHPPAEGETARAWLARLAQARPDRAEALAALAREADEVAYGGKAPGTLGRLAREEARAWEA